MTQDRISSPDDLFRRVMAAGSMRLSWSDATALLPHIEGAMRVDEIRSWAETRGLMYTLWPTKSLEDVRPEWVEFRRPPEES